MKKDILLQSISLYVLFCLLIIVDSCTTSRSKQSASNHAAKGKSWNLPLSSSASLPMMWIPAGTFIMGSPATEAGRKADEGPQTEVTLSKGYWLGKTEVTIGQWKAVTGLTMRQQVINMLHDDSVYDFGGTKQILRNFMRFNPNDPDKIMANENDSLPMYFVSWNDAMQFCKKLTTQEQAAGRLPQGYRYTLPTEAQWEYACRAGNVNPVYDVLDNIGWYSGNSATGYEGKRLGKAGPRNAGEKSPNAWGLQDMPGNLWEWCLDWYAPYPGGKVVDPVGPSTGSKRVDRGGSWGSGPNDERSANRASNPQPEKSAYRGFRIALSVI